MNLSAQEDTTISVSNECPQYNSFLNIATSASAQQKFDSILYYSDTIHPDGLIYLDPDKLDSTIGIPHLYDFMGVGSADYTFTPVKYGNGIIDTNEYFVRYREYYKGLRVEGGGYTAGYVIPSGPTYPPGPQCEQYAFMISPYLLDSIYLDTTPSISKNSLLDTVGIDSFETTELIFTHNISGNCDYNLVWYVNYYDTLNKNAWIDAHTGQILKTQDVAMSFNCPGVIKNAPTEVYGNQDLCNKEESGTAFLVSPSSSLKVYDLSTFNEDCRNIEVEEWVENLIPETNKSSWDPNDYSAAVYQGFHVGTQVQKQYKEKLGIDFGTIHLGVGCEGQNAKFLSPENGANNPYIFCGAVNSNGLSMAVYDIVAHELAHAIIAGYDIGYRRGGSSAVIGESISDIIATFIESEIQGSVDWITGDDNDRNNRNLQFPKYNCIYADYDEAKYEKKYKNETSDHALGTAIGHWFYLACEGNTANGFSTISMEKAVKIILQSLWYLPVYPTEKQFRDRTVLIANNEYGHCSDEYEAIAAAWEEVCVGNFIGKCDMELEGPRGVCEELDTLKICVEGGPGTLYYWTILGKKSTMYDILGQGTGSNSWIGGACLYINDFPKYPYYPQAITIKVKFKASGKWRYFKQRVILRDCGNNDPTCEDYHSGDNFSIEDENETVIKTFNSFPAIEESTDKTIEKDDKITRVEVYNLIGQLMFSGNLNEFKNYLNYKNNVEVLFKVSYDKDNKVIDSGKFINLNLR